MDEIKLPERPGDKADLMPLIQRYWDELNGEIGALSEAEMTAPGLDGGWAIKDHLAHMTTWERLLLARIEQLPERSTISLAWTRKRTPTPTTSMR